MHSEDILYDQNGYVIVGFINSNSELEHSIYKLVDGGCIDLEDRVYDKDELLKLLKVELDNFINRNIATTAIIGHNIRIVATDGQCLMVDDLDEEVYEISQLILDGNECGDIFIKSLGISGFWNIVQ